ncbi:MAG: hypothetical protein WC413_00515 [Candidatus Nanoarchaeia archaeon]
MSETQNQNREYLDGLVLTNNNYQIGQYMNEVKKGKKKFSDKHFVETLSKLKTNGEMPDLFINATDARIEGEAEGYLKENSESIDAFLAKYAPKILQDYTAISAGHLEDLVKKGKEEIEKGKTPEEKQALTEKIEQDIYQLFGDYFSELKISDEYKKSEKADKAVVEAEAVLDHLKNLEKDQIPGEMDAHLQKKYNLKYNTLSLGLNYNDLHAYQTALAKRDLGSKFVKCKDGKYQLNKELIQEVYGSQENLKKLTVPLLDVYKAQAQH